MNRNQPLKIAVIGSEYHKISHCDVIVSRWLKPFPTDHLYGWSPHRTRIASIWLDQIHPDRDLSTAKCSEFGIPRYETLESALTLGGSDLAVDAVLLICEHGDYPRNEYQQKLYPRKEMFDQVSSAFQKFNRILPVFFDKHLSWNPEWIREMYATVIHSKIPFFAGSSISCQPLIPEIQIPSGAKFREIVALYHNDLEDYLFHSMELVQSLIENRAGGETGVAQIIAWKDQAVWDALDQGKISANLLEEAVQTVSPEAHQAFMKFAAQRGTPVYAFQLCYHDGMKVTYLMQHDIVRKWTVACQLEGDEAIHAGCPQTAGEDHYYPHFARFCVQIEDFFISKISPIPLGRMFMTSMGTAFCMRSLAREGTPYITPDLRLPEATGLSLL